MLLKSARLTGISWMSDVWETSRVWVGREEEAAAKSRLDALRNTFMVRGAEGEAEVRSRIEWSLT